MMRVHVKILKGDECTVDVTEKDKVSTIKYQVEQKLNVPVSCQRLVHRGKPLSDDWTLKQCGVKESTKLFLVVKREESGDSSSNTGSPRLDLWDELHYFLLKHYRPADSKLIMENFRQQFESSLDSLSLDDIERIGMLQLKQKQSS